MGEAEKHPEHSSLHKLKLSASASHDIRNCLSSIQEAVNLMADGVVAFGEERGDLTLDICKRSVDRMDIFIGNLRDLSHSLSDTLEMKPVNCDFSQIIGEVMDSLRERIKQRRIEVEIEGLTGPMPAVLDKWRVARAILNIIENGIKFTPTGGKVIVSISQKEDGIVEGVITDNGVGIKQEDLGVIFDVFEKLDAVHSDVEIRGLGVGLPIARLILEMHGGNLTCESAFGKGSRFYFMLPLSQGKS